MRRINASLMVINGKLNLSDQNLGGSHNISSTKREDRLMRNLM